MTEQLVVRYRADGSQVQTELAKIQASQRTFATSLEATGARFKNMGSQFSAAGRALTAGVTLPIVGIGAAAIKTAIDFESAFAGVRKTVDATESEFAEMRTGIREMAMEIPTSAEELSRIAEAAGALGIRKADILGFTRTVADMGETTDLSTDAAATAFGKLGNVLGLTGDEYSRLGSAIVDLGNKGASTESEIVELTLRLAGSAKVAGFTTPQILGMSAALADAGINAEAGGTAMSRVIQKIGLSVAEQSKELSGFAKLAGESAATFSKAWRTDPAKALGSVITGLKNTAAEGGNLDLALKNVGITEARQIDTLKRLALAQNDVGKAIGIAGSAWQKNNALQAEAEKRYATVESQLKVFKNTVKDALITLGESLLPVLQNVLNGLKPVVDMIATAFSWFSRLPGPIQTVVFVFAGLVAAAGPVLMIIGSIATGIGAVMPVIAALGGVLGVVFSPFLLVIAAVAAAVIGLTVVIVKNWDTIKSWTLTVWNAVTDFFRRFWPIILAIFTGGIGLLVLAVVKNWDKVKAATLAVWNAIRAALSAVWGWIRTAVTTYFNAYRVVITTVWNTIRAATSAIWNAIRAVIAAAWNGIRSVVSGGINAVKSTLLGGWNAIKSAAQAAWNFVVGIFESAWRKISGIVSKITGALSKLAFWRSSPSELEVHAAVSTRNVVDSFKTLQGQLATSFGNMPWPTFERGPTHGRISGGDGASLLTAARGDGIDIRRIVAELRALREEQNARSEERAVLVMDGREIDVVLKRRDRYNSRSRR